jgi:hypothetical protein
MKSNPAAPGRLVNEYAGVVELCSVFDHAGFFAFGEW